MVDLSGTVRHRGVVEGADGWAGLGSGLAPGLGTSAASPATAATTRPGRCGEAGVPGHRARGGPGLPAGRGRVAEPDRGTPYGAHRPAGRSGRTARRPAPRRRPEVRRPGVADHQRAARQHGGQLGQPGPPARSMPVSPATRAVSSASPGTAGDQPPGARRRRAPGRSGAASSAGRPGPGPPNRGAAPRTRAPSRPGRPAGRRRGCAAGGRRPAGRANPAATASESARSGSGSPSGTRCRTSSSEPG